MEPLHWLLLGVGLGALRTAEIGQIMVAYISKRLGLKPKDLREYQAATDGSGEEEG